MLSALYVLTDLVLPKANEVTTTVIPILQMRKMKHRVYTAEGEEPRIKLRPCASIADALVHYIQLPPTLQQNCC